MATQRLFVATLVGKAGTAVAELFELWRMRCDRSEVDLFCESLRKHCDSLQILCFTEWIDRWLMGDVVPGPNVVAGERFQVACLSPNEARACSKNLGHQFNEQFWLKWRLQEANTAGLWLDTHYVVVIAREVLGPSATDEDVQRSLCDVPEWLTRIKLARTERQEEAGCTS